MKCELPKGHEGPHQETWKYGFKNCGTAVLTFTLSEKEAYPDVTPCDTCEKQPDCEGWEACTREDTVLTPPVPPAPSPSPAPEPSTTAAYDYTDGYSRP